MTDSIYSRLAKAQANMTNASKDASNPHFKSKYATLESVRNAVLPALNAEGIAVTQVMDGAAVATRFSANGETVETIVPLVGDHKTIQQLGSAITYARRYGLMMLAMVAPEDDDGNEAATAPPKPPVDPQKVKERIAKAGTEEQLTKAREYVESLELPEPKRLELVASIRDREEALNASDP